MHQVFNSAIERFFSKLNSYYALLQFFYGFNLLLIKLNWTIVDRNNGTIIEYILSLFNIYHI